MSLDVYIYDHRMASLRNPSVEVLEDDDSHLRIDAKYCSSMTSGNYGATLKSPSPISPIEIWLDDHSRKYASVSLRYLNGSTTTHLDVVLYLLPVPSGRSGGGGGGTGPGGGGGGKLETPEKIGAFINDQVVAEIWTPNEGDAVRTLVATVMHALSLPGRTPDLQNRLSRWINILENLGIWMGEDPNGNLIEAMGGPAGGSMGTDQNMLVGAY